MTNPTNLDDYLAGLGISDADDDTPTPAPHVPPPSLGTPAEGGLSQAALYPAEGGQESPEAALQAFLGGLADRFGPGLSVRVKREGNFLTGELLGDGSGSLGRLIGREGRVIEALDTLAYAAVSKCNQGEHLRVRVDVGGYRERHFQQLRAIAEQAAQRVAASGEPHTFQPMNAAERRVIHMYLKENPLVVTRSLDEGNSRRLVIEPAPAAP